MFAKKYIYLLHINNKEFWSMVYAQVKCLIWTVMEILCTCALQKGWLNWWRGLKIYVLTYFQVTEKKNKFFEEPPPQLKHQNFATMNLSRPLLKVIYEHLCMLSLKKDCHFFMSVKYKALNCCNLLVMSMELFVLEHFCQHFVENLVLD